MPLIRNSFRAGQSRTHQSCAHNSRNIDPLKSINKMDARSGFGIEGREGGWVLA